MDLEHRADSGARDGDAHFRLDVGMFIGRLDDPREDQTRWRLDQLEHTVHVHEVAIRDAIGESVRAPDAKIVVQHLKPDLRAGSEPAAHQQWVGECGEHQVGCGVQWSTHFHGVGGRIIFHSHIAI